ncbi:MAG: flagellar FliJ family protein [Desulfobacterales bacterium]|nr:flagellar FliJ family protein [Desulfobacterales bacterium]
MERFRLEKVLTHRRTLETMARQELAAAQQLEQEILLEVDAARRRLAACDQEFERLKRAGLTSQELILHQEHLGRQAEHLAALQERRGLVRRDIDSRRDLLIAASMDKRLLEKFKEKKDRQFRRELLRKENNILDEIAIRQFHNSGR